MCPISQPKFPLPSVRHYAHVITVTRPQPLSLGAPHLFLSTHPSPNLTAFWPSQDPNSGLPWQCPQRGCHCIKPACQHWWLIPFISSATSFIAWHAILMVEVSKKITPKPLPKCYSTIFTPQLKAHCKSNTTLKASRNCKMLTLPTTLFKLLQTEHGDSGNAPTSRGQGESSTKVTWWRGEVTYCRGMNKCSAADAICKYSSASPGVATFKFS